MKLFLILFLSLSSVAANASRIILGETETIRTVEDAKAEGKISCVQFRSAIAGLADVADNDIVFEDGRCYLRSADRDVIVHVLFENLRMRHPDLRITPATFYNLSSAVLFLRTPEVRELMIDTKREISRAHSCAAEVVSRSWLRPNYSDQLENHQLIYLLEDMAESLRCY